MSQARTKSTTLICISLILAVSGVVNAVPPTHTISGFVRTSGAVGLEGADVVGDNGSPATVTGADGWYSIVVSNHWDGTITISKTGWLITPASKTYSNVSGDIAGEDYSAYQPKISGTVRKADGSPLAGAVASGDNGGGSDTTDAAGYYEFFIPYNWTGAVSVSLAGYHFTDKNYSTPLISDQTVQDFTGYQPTISGYVKDAGSAGLDGVSVSADNGGGSDTTDATALYGITMPIAGYINLKGMRRLTTRALRIRTTRTVWTGRGYRMRGGILAAIRISLTRTRSFIIIIWLRVRTVSGQVILRLSAQVSMTSTRTGGFILPRAMLIWGPMRLRATMCTTSETGTAMGL